MSSTKKFRVDKWLWAVRVFKTRSMATEACTAGRVKISNSRIKPSRQVNVDDIITIQKGLIKITYRVTELIDKRVGAKIAQNAYEDLTTEDEKAKLKIARSQPIAHREKGSGRPTKKERRDIEKLKWRNN
jgi:ribosome-associated heat shock protein Hsp15